MHDGGAASLIAVPLYLRGVPVGVLTLASAQRGLFGCAHTPVSLADCVPVVSPASVRPLMIASSPVGALCHAVLDDLKYFGVPQPSR